jgi:glycosyltransferase involved in cell wall biosynthesis
MSNISKKTGVEFSVIIPSYNRAKLLARALDSILMQSYPAREIIVIDDGSSDATARLIRENYPEVDYRYQRHAGVSAARNRGISLASSRWIALLDSDDSWAPGKLEAQAAAIARNPATRLVHTNEIWIRNGARLPQKRRHRKYGGDIFERCLPLCVISPSAASIRRDVFDDVGLFDESLKACEDYDLWLRICAREPVSLVDEPLVIKFGGHADQLSRRIPGLDRYRIAALRKLIASQVLTDAQRMMALAALREKIRIYHAGAKKRRHHGDVVKYERMAAELARVPHRFDSC